MGKCWLYRARYKKPKPAKRMYLCKNTTDRKGYKSTSKACKCGLCLFILGGWGMTFQVALVLKNLPANVRDLRDMRLIPGSRRYPGRGHGNPFQYSCLENPPDRAAWQAMAHRVTERQQVWSDCTDKCLDNEIIDNIFSFFTSIFSNCLYYSGLLWFKKIF